MSTSALSQHLNVLFVLITLYIRFKTLYFGYDMHIHEGLTNIYIR